MNPAQARAQARAQDRAQDRLLPPATYQQLETFLRQRGSALSLIEHVDLQSRNTLERRLPKHRRQYDELEDIH